MKKLVLATILSTATFGFLSAQEVQKVEKKIEINEDGEDITVVIETTENGETKREVLTGDDARAYVESDHGHHHSRHRVRAHHGSHGHHGKSKSVIRVDITEDDIEEMKAEMKEIYEDIEIEMHELADDLENINVDSILQSVGVEIENSENEIRYRFNSNDDNSKSVIIMKSGGEDDEEEVDVDVRVVRDNKRHEKRVEIKRKSIMVEDHEVAGVKEAKVDDLRVYPIPATGSLTLEFENETNDMTSVVIKDLQGKEVMKKQLVGKGQKMLNLNIDSLPSGNYLIEIQQGDRSTFKKLVLE